MENKNVIILSTALIIVTAFLMYVYFDETYRLSFSDDLCESIGFDSYRGVEYVVIEDSGEMVVEGVLCSSDEGLRVVRSFHPDGSHR